MITLSSNISTDKIEISSQNGKVVDLKAATNNVIDIEFGQHPQVTVTDPGLSQRIAELEKAGWIYFINTQYTSSNQFEFNANEEFDLPLGGNALSITNAGTDLQTYLANNKLNPTNEGDLNIIRFEFNLDCDLSDRKGKLNFDIGAATRFNNANFLGSDDASTPEPVSIFLPYFVGETFIQNGALAKTTINGSGGLYDITILIGKLIHGEDI